jgi:toxin HigB-1
MGILHNLKLRFSPPRITDCQIQKVSYGHAFRTLNILDRHNDSRYYRFMIKSFANRETEKIFVRESWRKLPQDIHRRARIKLEILDATDELEDLTIPPSNRLEQLVQCLIRTFSDRDTEQFYATGRTRRFPPDIHRRAAVRLTQLNAATRIQDLRLPPSNRLEALSHDRNEQWSIRIND